MTTSISSSHVKVNFKSSKTIDRLKANLVEAELTAAETVQELLFDGPDPEKRAELLQNLALLPSLFTPALTEQIRESIYADDYDKAVTLFHRNLFD
jgi:hypothetical protein